MPVAQFDGSGGDTYALKTLTASSAFKISCEVYLPGMTIVALAGGVSASMLALGGPTPSGAVQEIDSRDYTGVRKFRSGDSAALSNLITASWQKIEMRPVFDSGTTWITEFLIDNASIYSDSGEDFGWADTDPFPFMIGAIFAEVLPGEVYLIRNVEVRDVSNAVVFSDDLAVDFSAWDSTTGSPTIVSSIPPPPQFVPTFTIDNLAHDGSPISTVKPVGGSLRWAYRLTQSGGPGDAQWAVALSDLTNPDEFAPYRTDWQLVMHFPDADDEPLIAGIVTPVNTGSESSGIFGEVRVQGKDWLHFLEQPYPFDFEDISDDVAANQLSDPGQLFKAWAAQTQETIIGDLMDAISGYEDAVAYTTSFEGTGWSETLDKEIGFGDDTTLLALILDVATLGSALGFDMWCDPDKTVHMVAPQVTDPSAVTPIYTLNSSNVVVPPLDWTNNGPLATDTVTFGQSANNTSRIGFSKYQASRDTYRRWVRFAQVDLTSTDTIAAAAASTGYQDRFPHKDLKLTIRPDLLDPADPTAGFRNLSGQPIAADYQVGAYHHIDANFTVVEQQFYSPDSCNWLCDLTLNQIYATDATPDA